MSLSPNPDFPLFFNPHFIKFVRRSLNVDLNRDASKTKRENDCLDHGPLVRTLLRISVSMVIFFEVLVHISSCCLNKLFLIFLLIRNKM